MLRNVSGWLLGSLGGALLIGGFAGVVGHFKGFVGHFFVGWTLSGIG